MKVQFCKSLEGCTKWPDYGPFIVGDKKCDAFRQTGLWVDLRSQQLGFFPDLHACLARHGIRGLQIGILSNSYEIPDEKI